jgi:predicted nucleic acid-binding protein
MKLVDSTVAIDYLRAYPPAAELLERTFEEGESLAASEIVRFEVLAGARESELGRLDSFFAALNWIVVDERIARLAGWLSRRFRRSHAAIDAPDYLIAATALALDAELLTTNVKHFPMLEGLQAAY